MIKLKDILTELTLPKKKWIRITDKKELDQLKLNLFNLIDNAYEPLGGHYDFTSPEKIMNQKYTFWKVVDIDEDPEADAVLMGKNVRGKTKHVGLGHDGAKPSKKTALTHKSDLLKSGGHYVEVNGRPAISYMIKGNVPAIEDEATVRKLLKGKDIIWHGEHPTDKTAPGKGWYTRKKAGHDMTKIIVGMV